MILPGAVAGLPRIEEDRTGLVVVDHLGRRTRSGSARERGREIRPLKAGRRRSREGPGAVVRAPVRELSAKEEQVSVDRIVGHRSIGQWRQGLRKVGGVRAHLGRVGRHPRDVPRHEGPGVVQDDVPRPRSAVQDHTAQSRIVGPRRALSGPGKHLDVPRPGDVRPTRNVRPGCGRVRPRREAIATPGPGRSLGPPCERPPDPEQSPGARSRRSRAAPPAPSRASVRSDRIAPRAVL